MHAAEGVAQYLPVLVRPLYRLGEPRPSHSGGRGGPAAEVKTLGEEVRMLSGQGGVPACLAYLGCLPASPTPRVPSCSFLTLPVPS